MKFCSNCGAQIADQAVVCVSCGTPVNNSAPVAQTVTQPVAVQSAAAPYATKYCPNCGSQIAAQAVVCINCGCAVSGGNTGASSASGMATAAKILMILGTIIMGFSIIPLAWCIPMTISYCNKLKNNQPVSTGFKVCCLLFVSFLGGIFMLCDKDH